MGTITVNALAVISSNQISVTFGGDTLAGAGGYQIGGGLTNATITAFGSTTGMSCSTTGVVTPTSNGSLSAQNGTYFVISSDQGYYRVALSVTANEYSVASMAEADAAFTASTPAGGKTIRFRSGTYAASLTRLAKNESFSSGMVLTGEAGAIVGDLLFENTNGITIENLEIYNSAATSGGVLLDFIGTCTNMTVQDCTIHGKYYDPLGDYTVSGSYTNGDGIRTTAGAGTGFSGTIRRCQIYDVNEGIVLYLAQSGAVSVTDNEIYHTYSDCMKMTVEGSGLTSTKEFSRNVLHSFVGSPYDEAGPHIDCLQFISTAGNNGLNMTNLTIRQNVAWEDSSTSRGDAVQGIVSFDDGGNRVIIKDAVIEGNSMHLTSYWGIGMKIDGGTFKNNTLVGTGKGDGILATNLFLDGATVTAVDASDNICDAYNLIGSSSFTTTGNVTMGKDGVTIPYSSNFDGPVSSVSSFANVKTAWSVSSGTAGAIGSGRGTYGDVRDETGWSWT